MTSIRSSKNLLRRNYLTMVILLLLIIITIVLYYLDSSLNDASEILCLLQVDQLKFLKEQLHLPSSFNNLSKNQFISSVLAYCAKQKPLLPHLSPLLALKKK